MIDKIFTNDFEQIESSINGLIFTDISDHLPVFHIGNVFTQFKETKSTNTYQRTVNKTNLTTFLNTVKDISWENIMECKDPCKSYNNFYCEFRNAFNTSFPTQQKFKRVIDHNKSPWITQGISKSVLIKNKLYRKFLKHPTAQSEIKYIKSTKID